MMNDNEPTIAAYCRVSTTDQSLDRQLESTTDYASREFDAALDDVRIYRDKSTGTDTERSGDLTDLPVDQRPGTDGVATRGRWR
jgi:predicted site-specific integrase-resolvase